VLRAYRSLLSMPHARAFVLAWLVARLSISMRALGAVLMGSQLTDSYGLAGAVAAALLGEAVAAPDSAGWWTATGSGGRCSRASRCTPRGARPSGFGTNCDTELGTVDDRGALRCGGVAGRVAGAGPVVCPRGRLAFSGGGVRTGVHPRRANLRAGTGAKTFLEKDEPLRERAISISALVQS
jgi:hypothetical protein